MSTDYLTELEPLVTSIAHEYARKFWRYGVEREDLAQEMWVWLIKHPKKVEQWLSEPEGVRPIAKTLRNESGRVAQAIKAQAVGYSTSDLSYYGKKELQNLLLPAMFDDTAWTEPPVSEEGGRSQRAPAEGGNWVAMLADVSRGFDQLGSDDRGLLAAFHRDGFTNVLLAEMYGVSPQAMSRRHDRAVGRLHKILGGDKPRNTHDDTCECEDFVGTRRVISNAAARAAQENYYEE